jgi:hypothetical protein
VVPAPSEPSPLLTLCLRFPTDAKFRETVRTFSDRVVAYVGYPEPEARRIAAMLDAAIGAILACASPGESGNAIDLRFTKTEEVMVIRLLFHTRARSARAVTGEDLERGLRARCDGVPAFEAIRAVMDRIEFGQEGGSAFCRLSRQLPPEP